jgi:serine/threonine-protein kinase
MLGPYTLHECLGTGGMASVHRATVELAGGAQREVALKRLLPHLASEPRAVDSFIREAKLASKLNHPNIVQVYELGQIDGTYFIALELLHGDPLVTLMRRAQLHRLRIPVGVVLSLFRELCSALDYAHYGIGSDGQQLRIIHRDLTPSNLIITDEGQLKIIDFGVAKSMHGLFSTNSGLIKGKFGYMPFEAMQGCELDARADIFAAGVVMWELLAGRRLFKGANQWETMEKIRRGDVIAPSHYHPDCGRDLDELVMRALARDYVDRWPSAAAMCVELEHIRRRHALAATPDQVRAWKTQLADQNPWAARPDSSWSKSSGEVTDVEAEHSISDVLEQDFAEAPVRRPRTEPSRAPSEGGPEIPTVSIRGASLRAATVKDARMPTEPGDDGSIVVDIPL